MALIVATIEVSEYKVWDGKGYNGPSRWQAILNGRQTFTSDKSQRDAVRKALEAVDDTGRSRL